MTVAGTSPSDGRAGEDALRAAPRQRLLGFLHLLGSGLLAGAGLVAIASNRWHILDSSGVIFVLLFVQWQTFCLTIAKCGLEQVVFVTVSLNPALCYDLRSATARRIAPLAALTAVVALTAFPAWAAIAMAVSVVMDAASLMIVGEMNARGRHGIAAISNLLSYPLLFVLLFVASMLGEAHPPQFAVLFVATSVARLVWLGSQRDIPPDAINVVPRVQVSIGAQQVGNYALFRSDQVLLGAAWIQAQLETSATFVAAYLFLAKLPELSAGVFNIVGRVLFPALLDPAARLKREYRGGAGIAVTIAGVAAIAVAGVAYLWFWDGAEGLTYADAVPFLVHAALILPVNLATFSMLSRGLVARVLRAIAVGLMAGLGLLLTGIVLHRPDVTPWVVPLQLAAFLGAYALLSPGRPVVLYAEAGERARWRG